MSAPPMMAFAAPQPPPLDSFAAELYAALAPLAYADAANGFALAKLCGAIGTMFQPVEDVARDVGDRPGWAGVLDVDAAPAAWLPWLAQFVGVTMTPGLAEPDQRARIKRADGFNRGTPAAMRTAAQAGLTGSRVVFFRERDAGDPYRLEVVTITSQTPDPAATLRALEAQKPGGILLAYRTSAGQDYQQVATDDGTYADVFATYGTYADLTAGGLS